MLYKCKYSNGVYSAVPLANMSDNSGGGSSTLSGLDDTDISSPAEGQPLIYDNTASKWKNGGAVIRGTGLASDSSYSNQTVIGKYNKNGSSNLFEIGNGTGTSSSSRYNALEVSSYGQVVVGGSPDVGGKLFRRRRVSDNSNRYPYISGEEFAYWINGSTGTSASQDFKRGELLVFDADGGLYVVDDGSGSTNLEEVVIHSGDTFVAKTYPHYSSGYNLIPATGFVAAASAVNFKQVGIFNVLRDVWGALFEKVSNKSNTQVNDSSKYPTSALVYGMNQNLGDPSSASGVTGADAFSKINTLSSDLANKGTFAHRGIYAGYVTASKNYINFFVPMDLAHGASNPSVNVAITSLSAYIGTSRLSFAGYFDKSYISVNAYKYGITVEIKFLSTYSVEAPVSVYADLNITVS